MRRQSLSAFLSGLVIFLATTVSAFTPTPPSQQQSSTPPPPPSQQRLPSSSISSPTAMDSVGRAGAVLGQLGGALAALTVLGLPVAPAVAETRQLEYMPSIEGRGYGKARTKYPDFVQTPSGLQYKDVREGKGNSPTVGDRVVIDWEGYTIGYYGRPYEAKGKTKGGAFDATDKEYLRFVLGKTPMIPALEEALTTMKPGGIRQVVVPAELGYPANDPKHDRVGPKPSTFSGQRALDFVLTNQGLVDKTLLINVELKRVDKPGERGFKG